jgi:AcrR family transcriptional regulator
VATTQAAATTTIETARRAGLSRGAQLHHFPTKAELLTAAVEHLLHRKAWRCNDSCRAVNVRPPTISTRSS